MKFIAILSALLVSASLSFAAEGDRHGKPPGGGDRPQGPPPGEEGKRPSPEEMFKRLDTNTDGSISKEEFLASPRAQKDPERAAKAFEHKDKDKSGSLNAEELATRPEGGKGVPEGERPRGPRPEGGAGGGGKKPGEAK